MACEPSPSEAEPSHRTVALLAGLDLDLVVAATDSHQWDECWMQKRELVEELVEAASASSTKVVVSSVRH